ncbi:hypothetical protein [Arenicella xantha]|uniref:Uncharacterized protein n=1 Tax=Arenicella xantha TaxID=644221 RepID=A0A395JNI9_9GAMM|nr:hypothetical protein [Arenicella xantha]RBP52863.1 hypothetical protein DFR28_101247 [Arenicella xantha]
MNIEEMDTKYLSAKALALVSEFALTLYRLNRTIINVDADDVLFRVSEQAMLMQGKDDRLHAVYKRLRVELQRNFLTSLPPSSAAALRKLLANQDAISRRDSNQSKPH